MKASDIENVDFKKIEKKWQKRWEKDKAFEAKENSKKEKCYVLEQFPYPSGSGLHMGHAFIYTIGDIYARFKRMQGFNVLYPMGFDSFGLPAENAAIKNKSHPKKFTEDAIKNFIRHFKEFGNSYDWSRIVETHKPDYYKWDQWIFLKMFEKGLAYRKKAPVNWCSKCRTVLANEQVHNGKCWRHEDNNVEVRHLEQWFLKITDYADELYENLNNLDWPEEIKSMQKNWIGKSEGAEIGFEIDGEKWPIFTTRPDTLFGVTFLVVSAQHPKLMELVADEKKKEVEEFLKKIKSTSEKGFSQIEKEGIFTGSYAIHPLSGEKIPVWVGNFVVADYGCGMVMGVPAHDQRDFEFAKKYGLKIKEVVKGGDVKEKAYDGSGELTNSGDFDGLDSVEGKEHIIKALEFKKLGRRTVNFKLRDWLISRQRFWGTPIPIIYCDRCGIVPVSEKDLPVKLPDNIKFESERNPLTENKKFIDVKCPKCKGKARRETDTMDTFVNSSWYYLRYLDSKNKKKIFDSKKANYWMPIDIYIGGKEHACMHDIYFRFYHKFFRELGMVEGDEPAVRLFNQGFVYGSDGRKMSKSLGNEIIPGKAAKKYGVDAVRLFLVSSASLEKDFNWSDNGAEGSMKFVRKAIDYCKNVKIGRSSKKTEHKANKAIKEVTEDVENFRYNFAVIKMRGLFDSLEDEIGKKDLESFLKMFSVFCPHVAEELWSKLGNKKLVSLSKWSEVDEKKIDEKFDKEERAVEKTVSDILNILKIVKGEKVYVYVLPSEIEFYSDKELELRVGKSVKVFAVNDKNKYDPANKSNKVKPGRPGIFVE